MKHLKSKNKLEKTSSHRAALLSNMANSMLRHSRIVTTLSKAKEFRKYIEPIVTRAKTNTLHARRQVLRLIKHPGLLGKLFDTIAPKFKDRPGGYTRIIRLGRRMNDGAEMAVMEFVENFVEKKEVPVESTAKSTVKISTTTAAPADKLVAKLVAKPAEKTPVPAVKPAAKKPEKPAKKSANKKSGK